MTCVVCRGEPATVGVLCENCRDEVAAPVGLLPQQILATIAKPDGDALVDQWGRPHPLEARTMIGRALDGTGITILEAAVSRHHAHLARDANGCCLRDLGSCNGTFVNEVQVTESTMVSHGDRITIGAVGFYFVDGIGAIPEVVIDPAVITTIQSIQQIAVHDVGRTIEQPSSGVPSFVEREHTDVGLATLPLRLSEPTGGGGGVLQLGHIAVQLSSNQTELVGLLWKRMLDEAHQPTQVRGFVRTSELVATLSWDTRGADDNHVKQLIRRIRRLLIREGLGDLIESRQRFGYRLRAIPQS